MAKKSGLGKGLEALIPSTDDRSAGGMILVDVDDIDPGEQQPRSVFDEESLDGLADSIRQVGLLQPVILREVDDRYQLVAGERRWRAARKAGLRQIPALVRASDGGTSLVEALVENLQREDLNALEEGAAFSQLLEEFGMTHEDVGERVGRSRSAITNTIRLLQLPPAVQGMLERGELSAGHARALLGTEDARYAVHVAQRAVDGGWSVRQVEEAIRDRSVVSDPGAPGVREVRPAAIIELEQRLTEQLDARVSISWKKERGAIRIKYGSLEELERLYRSLSS